MSPARSQPGRDAPGAGAGRAREAPDATLCGLVDLVLSHLPDGLIGAPSAARVRDAARGVPAELVARFGLQCDVGSQAADADVLFCADAETGGMQLLAGRHPLVNLPDSLATADGWAPVMRFCRRREPGFLLHRVSREVWVDLASYDAPSFSFGVRVSGPAEATRRPREALIRALEVGLDALRGAPLEPPTLTSMRVLVRRLPETARVERAGVLAGHPDDALLWLAGLAPRDLVDLVDATRDRGEARELHAVLADLVQPAGDVRARLEVREGVGRSIGLICGVDRAGSPPQVAARWGPLLDRLVDAGLCSGERRDALLVCHGLLRERQAASWPEHLTRLSALLGDGTDSILQWHLRHITVECDRGEPVRATARIVATYGWSPRQDSAPAPTGHVTPVPPSPQ